MEKLLEQEQINAMIRAMRGQSKASTVAAKPQAVVSEYDLRHPTHLTKEQVRAITSLHDTISLNLSHAMGAYLRVGFDATVVSVEQLSYAEFLGRLPDVTYLCSLNVSPVAASAVMQLDLQLAFPIIDLLLGGVGAPIGEVRQATEIEEELLAGIVKIIAREFAAGWSTVGFDMTFDERQLPAAAQRLMRPTEKTLVISFELRIPEIRGMLIVAFPAVVANAFLRKLLRETAPKAKATSAPEEQSREVLLDCPFPVHLEIARTSVSLRDLVEMTPGTVLSFRHTIRDPIVLSANNVQLFEARPVRTERYRGAQLHQRLQLTAGEDSHER